MKGYMDELFLIPQDTDATEPLRVMLADVYTDKPIDEATLKSNKQLMLFLLDNRNELWNWCEIVFRAFPSPSGPD